MSSPGNGMDEITTGVARVGFGGAAEVLGDDSRPRTREEQDAEVAAAVAAERARVEAAVVAEQAAEVAAAVAAERRAREDAERRAREAERELAISKVQSFLQGNKTRAATIRIAGVRELSWAELLHCELKTDAAIGAWGRIHSLVKPQFGKIFEWLEQNPKSRAGKKWSQWKARSARGRTPEDGEEEAAADGEEEAAADGEEAAAADGEEEAAADGEEAAAADGEEEAADGEEEAGGAAQGGGGGKKSDREETICHPMLRILLSEILADVSVLQLYHHKASKEKRPDFVVHNARDHADCNEANLVPLEVKWPKDLRAAWKQVLADYTFPRCDALVDDRLQEPTFTGSVEAIGFGTDCIDLVAVRTVVAFENGVPSLPQTSHTAPLCLFADTDAPPDGFVWLFSLLHQDIAAFFDINALVTESGGVGLGPRIGVGGWSSVFSASEDPNTVVKIVRAPHASKMAASERRVVQKFAESTCPSLPQLSELDALVGKDALAITPCGIPLAQFFESVCSAERSAVARRVTSGVLSALSAAHASGYIHCDVRVSNVVMVGPKGSEHAVLVDWGVAMTKSTKQLQGLVGVAEWVHDDVLLRTWAPQPRIDLTAAAYLYATLESSGDFPDAPWKRQCQERAREDGGRGDGGQCWIVVKERAKWFAAHKDMPAAKFLARVQRGENLYALPPE